MTKVPLKWKKVGDTGKVEINGESDSTFSSDAPALKVNGDISSDNLTTLTSRVDTIESTLPSLIGGVVKATTPMTISSGKPSDLENEKGKVYSNGIAFPDSETQIKAVWFRVGGAGLSGPDAEIGMGDSSGVLYLRHYDANNSIIKEATLLDKNGNAAFPSTISASTFSGNLNGIASRAEKLGSVDIGSPSIPIYLNEGAPAACSSWLNGTISSIGLSSTLNYSKVGSSAVSSSCTNDTATYTYAQTSGDWGIGTVSAKRVTNVVHISISIKGTGNAVRLGQAGFVGQLTAGSHAALPAKPLNLFTNYENFPIICNITSSGVVTFTPLGISDFSTSINIPSGTEVTASGTFICVS